jgi:hypothetical protein
MSVPVLDDVDATPKDHLVFPPVLKLLMLLCAFTLWHLFQTDLVLPRKYNPNSMFSHERPIMETEHNITMSLCPSQCHCPSGARHHKPLLTPNYTCHLLANTHTIFIGDSILQHVWLTTCLYLLLTQNINLQDLLSDPDKCKASSWNLLETHNAREFLGHRFDQANSMAFSLVTITPCPHVNISFVQVSTLRHLQFLGEWTTHSNYVILSPTLDDMSRYAENMPSLLADTIHLGKQWFMGMHARIPRLAPIHLRWESLSQQGNTLFTQWNTYLQNTYPGKTVNPFNLTANLNGTELNTHDGLHFDLWFNLQKMHMLLHAMHQTTQSQKKKTQFHTSYN